MSFLGGRLAGRETAYFVEESKQAVSRLLEKKPHLTSSSNKTPPSHAGDESAGADVLPEVLRHSLPSKLLYQSPLSEYSPPVSTSAKWSVQSPLEESRVYGASPDVMNPLRGYLVLPQVTFGPKRWQLPEVRSSVNASTANELRHDQHTSVDPEEIKAAAQGLARAGQSFAVATGTVFGSAALTFGLVASSLQIHNSDDIRVKGREMVQPRVESLKEELAPLRNWVDQASKKWHHQIEQDLKEKPLIKLLSEKFHENKSR